jgi:hypothetical protein
VAVTVHFEDKGKPISMTLDVVEVAKVRGCCIACREWIWISRLAVPFWSRVGKGVRWDPGRIWDLRKSAPLRHKAWK